MKRIAFSQRSEKFIKYDFISPEGTLFNEAENILQIENNIALTHDISVPSETNKIQDKSDLIKKKNQKNNSLLFDEQSSHKSFPSHIPREVITHDLNENEKIIFLKYSEQNSFWNNLLEKRFCILFYNYNSY